MIFSSVEFLIFLISSFLFYWFVFQKNLKAQNIFLLVISYFFYGWWNWHFLALIFISSAIDYVIGLQLGKDKSEKSRKILLAASIIV
ncbi:MAG: MBOAT family protein, partial [Bacteroidetes bacterium]